MDIDIIPKSASTALDEEITHAYTKAANWLSDCEFMNVDSSLLLRQCRCVSEISSEENQPLIDNNIYPQDSYSASVNTHAETNKEAPKKTANSTISVTEN